MTAYSAPQTARTAKNQPNSIEIKAIALGQPSPDTLYIQTVAAGGKQKAQEFDTKCDILATFPHNCTAGASLEAPGRRSGAQLFARRRVVGAAHFFRRDHGEPVAEQPSGVAAPGL